jgi:hypothetical protein
MVAVQNGVRDEPERLTAKALRHFMAEHDVLISQIARRAGRSRHHMTEVVHARRPISQGLDERLRAAMAEIERERAG